jgi:stearoyl-CoA desaturase (delta-9 desaturase)
MNPIGLLELPTTLIACIYYSDYLGWSHVLPCFMLYLWKEMIPMSTVLHRYFTHRGFKCNRLIQFVFYLIGCLASQGGPIWWASKHRRHHAKCDTVDDPHSPIAFSKMYAWLGWVYLVNSEGPLGSGVDIEYVSDLMEFPELVYMESFHMIPVITMHYIFYIYGGIGYCVFVSMLSSIMCQALTLYFNVMAHGNKETSKSCKALDNPSDTLSNLFGEAYHEWHHTHPIEFHRPGIDLPFYLFINPLIAMGVIQSSISTGR